MGFEKVRFYTDGCSTQFVNCRASLCGGLDTDAMTSQALIVTRLQEINVFELSGKVYFDSMFALELIIHICCEICTNERLFSIHVVTISSL